MTRRRHARPCLQVNKVATEWEQVYKELETLYFTARDDAARKTEALGRAHRDLEFWKSEAMASGSLATKQSIESGASRLLFVFLVARRAAPSASILYAWRWAQHINMDMASCPIPCDWSRADETALAVQANNKAAQFAAANP